MRSSEPEPRCLCFRPETCPNRPRLAFVSKQRKHGFMRSKRSARLARKFVPPKLRGIANDSKPSESGNAPLPRLSDQVRKSHPSGQGLHPSGQVREVHPVDPLREGRLDGRVREDRQVGQVRGVAADGDRAILKQTTPIRKVDSGPHYQLMASPALPSDSALPECRVGPRDRVDLAPPRQIATK